MNQRAFDTRNYIREHRAGLSVLQVERKKYEEYRQSRDKTKYDRKPFRIGPTHLALYTALLSIWNDAVWPEVITPSVRLIHEKSFLAENTYRSCLEVLRELGILTFSHSKVENEAIRIRMQPLYSKNTGGTDSKLIHMDGLIDGHSDSKSGSYINTLETDINYKKNKNDFFSELSERASIIE